MSSIDAVIMGSSSSIARELSRLRECAPVIKLSEFYGSERYFICTGYLSGKKMTELDYGEACGVWEHNYVKIASFLDSLFERNTRAKVCVMGSYSGIKGSYDMAYAGAKAALHLYVKTKKLKRPEQNLICLAPTIIEDTNMTQRRSDLDDCLRKGEETKLGRWLRAEEVARVANKLIDEVSLCNSVIEMTGGNHV